MSEGAGDVPGGFAGFLLGRRGRPGWPAPPGGSETTPGLATTALLPEDCAVEVPARMYLFQTKDYGVRIIRLKNELLWDQWENIYIVEHKAHEVTMTSAKAYCVAVALCRAVQGDYDNLEKMDAELGTNPVSGATASAEGEVGKGALSGDWPIPPDAPWPPVPPQIPLKD